MLNVKYVLRSPSNWYGSVNHSSAAIKTYCLGLSDIKIWHHMANAILPDMKESRITVLLLRHGEREDESIKHDMSITLSPKEAVMIDTLDPSLTAAGYEQATKAWQTILMALQKLDRPTIESNNALRVRHRNKKKITLVCSPLRRCVGTAMSILSALPLILPPPAAAAASASAKAVEETVTTTGLETSQVDFCSSFKVNFGSPDADVDSTSVAETNTAVSIPIFVMNGLATCAAAIFKLGGVTKAIQRYGYDAIPCAVIVGTAAYSNNNNINDSNTNNNLHDRDSTISLSFNRFNAALQAMIHVADKPFRNFMIMKSQQQNQQLGSSTVQFFGRTSSDKHTNNHRNQCWVPMSSEITSQLKLKHRDGVVDIDTNRRTATPSFTTPERQRPLHPTKATLQSATITSNRDLRFDSNNKKINTNNNFIDESFMNALNEAVRMALDAAGTTTTDDDNDDEDEHRRQYLIVITHREGIRYLIEHCKDYSRSVKTPYCCIGTFTATAVTPPSPDTKSDISYTFHNVSPYEDFTLEVDP